MTAGIAIGLSQQAATCRCVNPIDSVSMHVSGDGAEQQPYPMSASSDASAVEPVAPWGRGAGGVMASRKRGEA